MELETQNLQLSGSNIAATDFFAGLDELKNGFAIYDQDLKLTFANKAVRRYLPILYKNLDSGLTLLDSITGQVREFHPDLDSHECKRRAANVVATIKAEETVEVIAADGQIINSVYKKLKTGQYVIVSTDITQRVRNTKALAKAQHAAERADSAKTEFLANMSHEIRTPLSGIFMSAQLLQQQLRALNHPELSSVADILVGSTTHLSEIINNVLDLSKIEAGQIDINTSESSVVDLLRNIKNSQGPVAKEAGLEIKLVIDPNLPDRLTFDALHVRQCLNNLVSNALKFTETGSVTIAALFDSESHRVTLHVVDTGIGISQENKSRVFDEFRQVRLNADMVAPHPRDALPANSGTGLGLPISRKLAQLMGGDIKVTSELGKGSIFTLTFTGEPIVISPESVADAA